MRLVSYRIVAHPRMFLLLFSTWTIQAHYHHDIFVVCLAAAQLAHVVRRYRVFGAGSLLDTRTATAIQSNFNTTLPEGSHDVQERGPSQV